MESSTYESDARPLTRKTVACRRLYVPTKRRSVRKPSFSPNEQAMLFWIKTAARFHTDPAHHAIVALKTVLVPAADQTGAPALYVWEVAWCQERSGIKWEFIVWDVSGYGVRFRDCASQDEAMALYHRSPEQGIAAGGFSPESHLRADQRLR